MKTISTSKKLIAALLAFFMMIATAFLFASCDNGDNGDNGDKGDPKPDGNTLTYSVTVVDDENKPVSGIIVQWCNDKNCYSSSQKSANQTTDATGKITLAVGEISGFVAGDYTLQITRGLPEGYTYEQDEEGHYTPTDRSGDKQIKYATQDKPDVTIKLIKK